jgi:hypothetical protein
MGISVRDLTAIVTQCTKPEQFQLNMDAIQLYQKSSLDFNAIICDQAIQNALAAKNPVAIAKLIVTSKHRLGSWLNESSLTKLVQALVDANEVDLAAKVVQTSISRGLKVASKQNFQTVIESYGKVENKDHVPAFLEQGKSYLSSADFESLPKV